MPRPYVVRKGGFGVRHDVRANGLIEDDGEPSASRHPQLPRAAAASLDSAVIRRRIGRPSEPCGDREIRGGYGDRGSRDPIPDSVEVPRATDLPSDVGRAGNGPMMYVF